MIHYSLCIVHDTATTIPIHSQICETWTTISASGLVLVVYAKSNRGSALRPSHSNQSIDG